MLGWLGGHRSWRGNECSAGWRFHDFLVTNEPESANTEYQLRIDINYVFYIDYTLAIAGYRHIR